MKSVITLIPCSNNSSGKASKQLLLSTQTIPQVRENSILVLIELLSLYISQQTWLRNDTKTGRVRCTAMQALTCGGRGEDNYNAWNWVSTSQIFLLNSEETSRNNKKLRKLSILIICTHSVSECLQISYAQLTFWLHNKSCWSPNIVASKLKKTQWEKEIPLSLHRETIPEKPT